MAWLSVNEMTTFRWSFEEDVARYAEAGIGAIGVWRQKVSDYGEDKAAELLSKHGLKVSNLLWAGGFTGSDGRTFQDSVEDGLEAIRQAVTLGAPCVVVYSGARAGHTYNHARRLLREALKKMLPLAEEHGVDLALEPMHPGCAAEWTFVTTLDDAQELIEELGSSRLKIAVDTYHLGFDPENVERIKQLARSIAIVHLGDGRSPPEGEQSRCPLGEGAVPLKDFCAALSASGYGGFYDVELIGEEIEPLDYGELLSGSKQAFQELVGAE